jgi:hypothetical protein
MIAATLFALAGLLHADNGAIGDAGNFAPPVKLEAAGQPIDVHIGHAAPFACDWDGDGVKDLLVGQFGEGKLLVYKNVGTATEPELAAAELFMAGGEAGRIPSG